MSSARRNAKGGSPDSDRIVLALGGTMRVDRIAIEARGRARA